MPLTSLGKMPSDCGRDGRSPSGRSAWRFLRADAPRLARSFFADARDPRFRLLDEQIAAGVFRFVLQLCEPALDEPLKRFHVASATEQLRRAAAEIGDQHDVMMLAECSREIAKALDLRFQPRQIH